MNVRPGAPGTTTAARTAVSGSEELSARSGVDMPLGPDDGSFTRLVEAEYRAVVAAAAMIIGSTALAEEMAQDAFERAYARWGRVARLDRPGAWVRRVALNRAISATRSRSSERRAMDRVARMDTTHAVGRSTSPIDLRGVDDDAARLWASVRALPANQARAVALHYGSDLSLEMVAAEMDTTVSSVKSLLHRARSTLRNDLTADDFEEYTT